MKQKEILCKMSNSLNIFGFAIKILYENFETWGYFFLQNAIRLHPCYPQQQRAIKVSVELLVFSK